MCLEHIMYLKYFHTTPFHIFNWLNSLQSFFYHLYTYYCIMMEKIICYDMSRWQVKYNHFKKYCYCWRYGNCTYHLFTLLSNSITFSKLPQLTDNYEVFVSLVVTIMCLIDTTMMVCIICICNLWRTLFGKNMYLTKVRFAATWDTL